MTNRAYRSTRRGIVEGVALLVVAGLTMAGLSACGAPSYKYVADSPNKAYYKVPAGWSPLTNTMLTPAIQGHSANWTGQAPGTPPTTPT